MATHAARGRGDCRLRTASSPVKPPAATSPHPVVMVDTCIRPSAAPMSGPPRRSITCARRQPQGLIQFSHRNHERAPRRSITCTPRQPQCCV
jgi:hypothetical protein